MMNSKFSDVVTDLELGPYKGLAIDCSHFRVDEALVIQEIEAMVKEKLPPLGEEDSPTINDEVVELLEIDGINNLKALEVYIEKHLLNDMVINEIMRIVLDGVKIIYDEDKIEEQLEPMIKSLEEQAVNQGFTLAFYCDYNGIDSIDGLKELYREEIRTSYLEMSVLGEIIDREEIVLEEAFFQEALHNNRASLDPTQAIDEEALYFGLVVKEAVNRLVQWNLKS